MRQFTVSYSSESFMKEREGEKEKRGSSAAHLSQWQLEISYFICILPFHQGSQDSRPRPDSPQSHFRLIVNLWDKLEGRDRFDVIQQGSRTELL